jgi:hypothetical protein
MRYVVGMDSKLADFNEPLVTWLKEPTLWPAEDVNDQGVFTSTIRSTVQPRILMDEFPQFINLEHVYHVIKFVDVLETVRRIFVSVKSQRFSFQFCDCLKINQRQFKTQPCSAVSPRLVYHCAVAFHSCSGPIIQL